MHQTKTEMKMLAIRLKMVSFSNIVEVVRGTADTVEGA